jgi:hypothetical protein
MRPDDRILQTLQPRTHCIGEERRDGLLQTRSQTLLMQDGLQFHAIMGPSS